MSEQLELTARRTGPSISRGTSNQVVGTPPQFIQACEEKFGAITFDLAASPENAKRPDYFTKEQNSLVQIWHKIAGVLWLNPEFSNIGAWASKCRVEAEYGAKILMLVPASVGSNWYRDHVFEHARSVFMNGRIRFIGETDDYPKDLMICAYGLGDPGCEIWRLTKEQTRRPEDVR